MLDPSSLQFVLSQFRASYPGGSLTAELLQIYQESYVVRAVVQVAGTIVATGMATATNLEQAEDRARIRALEVLGILPLPTMPVASPANLIPGMSLPQIDPDREGGDRPLTPHLHPLPATTAEKPPTAPKPNKSTSRSQAERSSNSVAVDESLTTPDVGSLAAKTPPIDLSEIIDQTSVEMKRLGWTTEQGRQYLKQRFGKESRQQLSTDELEQFLDYLKLL